MAITFRDLGVMLHHTRDPFRLTTEDYAALVEGDSNWTGQHFQAGVRGANLVEDTIRFARSDGAVERFGTNDEDILTPDVVMAVVEVPAANQTRMCRREEVCVISYRGTDREHQFFPERYRFQTRLPGLQGEGGVPLTMEGARSFTCEIKEGYLENYRETAPAVRDFLFEMMETNRCSGGIVFMGMSLGGATADVASAAYMLDRPRANNHPRLEQMRQAGNMWTVTAGAPRSLGRGCANRLQADWGDNKHRFIYGDDAMEEWITSFQGCPAFLDPVPGNPTAINMRGDFDRTIPLRHWGQTVVGLLEPPENHRRHVNIDEFGATCGEMCMSRAYAQANSRVTSDLGRLWMPERQNYGGACTSPELVPERSYQFGRFHDTCSYRNLFALYGERRAGETGFESYQCRLCGDDEDPSSFPDPIRARDGRRGAQELTRFGPSQRSGANTCPAIE